MTRTPGDFTLLDVSLYTDELGRLAVPLARLRGGGAEPPTLDLPEGAVLGVGLRFRLGRDVDGLAFEETRTRAWALSVEGESLSATRTVLGGFRAGGPYELRLPPERLPVGREGCAVYEVTGRFTDGEGHELARERHRFRVVHRSPASASAPGAAPPAG
ncbi:hypothetical protein [Streptomyces sp. NPDC003327]